MSPTNPIRKFKEHMLQRLDAYKFPMSHDFRALISHQDYQFQPAPKLLTMLLSILCITASLSIFAAAHPVDSAGQNSSAAPQSGIALEYTSPIIKALSRHPEIKNDAPGRIETPKTHHKFDDWQEWGSYEDIDALVRCTRVPDEGYWDFYTSRNLECFFWRVGDDAVPGYMFTPCSGQLVHHLGPNRHYRLNSGFLHGDSIWVNCYLK
jgi:hypothetical protein